jgi:AhpC/TSA family
MGFIVGRILVLCLSMAVGQERQDKQQTTPEQQYKTLLEQYNRAFDDYAKAFREAKLPQDREKLIQRKYPRPDKWAAKFLELAEQNPKEPFAEEALIWIMTSEARLKRFLPWHEHTARYEMIWIIQARNAVAGDKDERDIRDEAVDMLLRDHVTSPKMGQVAQVISRDQHSARLLRGIIDMNPSSEVKAEACLTLFRQIQGDIALARQLKDNPQLAKTAGQFYGKAYLDEMQNADLAKLEADGEKLFGELTEKYVLDMKPARLIELCQELKYSSDSERRLLRFLYENSDRDEVRGVACLILAQVLKGRASSLADTDTKGAEIAQKESEALLEEATVKYADVEMPLEGKVGKKAKGILFELRHLSVGKEAPEIEGVDQDGKQFKLSDYRGKVVLLDFWSEF